MTRLVAPLVALALLEVVVPAQGASLPSAGGFLERQLDAQGCAREPGASASVNLTAWAALGLRAAGRSASRPASCIERHARRLSSTTDIELATLALVAAGRNPRSAGGRNFVADLERATRGGRIGPTIASTQFGVLALRAAGAPIPAAVRLQVLRDQNPDGTWPVSPGGPGDSNLTASGIAAAVAAGVSPSSRSLQRAGASLQRFRQQGGYGLMVGSRPDAQSTAWVLQGLAALGRRDRTAEAFLGRLQLADGSFAYQRGQRITPVWVTAQASLGLARRSFPLRP